MGLFTSPTIQTLLSKEADYYNDEAQSLEPPKFLGPKPGSAVCFWCDPWQVLELGFSILQSETKTST